MTQKAADDFEAIRRRLEEIEAEAKLALTGSSAPQTEQPKSVESVYGVDYCGYGQALNQNPKLYENLYQATAGNQLAGIGNGMVGGLNDPSHQHGTLQHGVLQNGLGSLIHPQWPYAGTGFEWRKFVRS